MKKFLVAAMLLVTMIFAGCGGSDSAGGDKKLSVMLGSNVVSLDSAQATDVASFEVIADCIDGLMQLDADGKAIPALAESYDVSADGKTYTFHLRAVGVGLTLIEKDGTAGHHFPVAFEDDGGVESGDL
ncbi:MAG: hypothetical protein IKN16_11440, partial [Selenomonadaceae bacterium]|nr:hypothetical protein [Selenomonadaceae bacterium]